MNRTRHTHTIFMLSWLTAQQQLQSDTSLSYPMLPLLGDEVVWGS